MREGWVEYKFKDIASAAKGKLPKDKNEGGIGVLYLTANYLRTGIADFWIQNSEGTISADDGDCLILWDGAGAGDLFRAPQGIVSSTMAVIKPTNRSISREFLTLYVSSKASYIKETCRGTTVPHVSPDAILNMDLRIPPLQEQKRIVDLISSVDSYIDALQQQADSARKSRSAVLHEMLSVGGDGWTETTLGEVAGLEMGRTPSRSNPDYWTEDLAHPFCTIADMESRWVDPYREGVSLKAIHDGKAKMAKTGTLLMSFKLTIGRMGFAKRDIYPNEAIVMIDPKPALASREYLFNYLGQKDLSAGTGKAIKGSTLNSKSLAAIDVVLPPLQEQKRIVDLISSMDKAISATERAITESKNLRSGLLSDLLSGDHEIPESYDSLIGIA
jgi:type I restriction enzyme S subunit